MPLLSHVVKNPRITRLTVRVGRSGKTLETAKALLSGDRGRRFKSSHSDPSYQGLSGRFHPDDDPKTGGITGGIRPRRCGRSSAVLASATRSRKWSSRTNGREWRPSRPAHVRRREASGTSAIGGAAARDCWVTTGRGLSRAGQAPPSAFPRRVYKARDTSLRPPLSFGRTEPLPSR
jgi:hypothetical protein